MRGFIAGATRTGPRCASAASVSTLSASPCASFASVFAVSGRDHEQVGARQVRVEILVRGPTGKCGKGLPANESIGTPSNEWDHLVASPDKQARQLTRLVGGDAAGDSEKNPRHADIACPLERRTTAASRSAAAAAT